MLLDDARLVLDPAHAAVEALEDRPRVVVMVGGQPCGTQHGGHRGEGHRVVLGREGVDRRGDDGDLGFVEPLPGVGRAREDVGIGPFHVAEEEVPRLARAVVGHVEADVRAPDDGHARLDQRRDHAGGLGVVQQHDVAGPHALREQVGVLGRDGLVDGPLGVAQRAAVAGEAVQAVVQALGDAEEVLVAADRHPARVDLHAARVADQRAQHLGDPATVRGGVDVPEDAIGQQLAPVRDRLLELRQALRREDVTEALGIQRRDLDVLESHGRDPTSPRRPRGGPLTGDRCRRRRAT